MKNLFFAMFVIMITSSFAFSQSWSTIEYNNNIKNFKITVESARSLTFYNTSPAARADQIYHTVLTKTQISDLTNFMNKAGFLSAGFNPNFMDKGGSTRTVLITLSDGKVVTLNDNLGDKNDIANFQSLVADIESLVPTKFWTENGISKDTYDGHKKTKKKKRHHRAS